MSLFCTSTSSVPSAAAFWILGSGTAKVSDRVRQEDPMPSTTPKWSPSKNTSANSFAWPKSPRTTTSNVAGPSSSVATGSRWNVLAPVLVYSIREVTLIGSPTAAISGPPRIVNVIGTVSCGSSGSLLVITRSAEKVPAVRPAALSRTPISVVLAPGTPPTAVSMVTKSADAGSTKIAYSSSVPPAVGQGQDLQILPAEKNSRLQELR